LLQAVISAPIPLQTFYFCPFPFRPTVLVSIAAAFSYEALKVFENFVRHIRQNGTDVLDPNRET
jgi:hypothetical protein